MSATTDLPGFGDGATRVEGKVNPTAQGAEGAETGSGGGTRRSPDEILRERREGNGEPPPSRGPGRPRLNDDEKSRRKRERDRARYAQSKGRPVPPPDDPGDPSPLPDDPGGSAPSGGSWFFADPSEPFVPWTREDFVGMYSGTFSAVGRLRYPDAPEPWESIGGNPAASPPIPPNVMCYVMADRTAAVCNKWRFKMPLKEEFQLLTALGGTVWICVNASEAIREQRAREKNESAPNK